MLQTPIGAGGASLWELPEPTTAPTSGANPTADTAPAPAPAPAPAAPPRAGTIVQRLEALEATVATLLAAAEENSALRRRVEGLEALVGA